MINKILGIRKNESPKNRVFKNKIFENAIAKFFIATFARGDRREYTHLMLT
jgi:hypothetical protein